MTKLLILTYFWTVLPQLSKSVTSTAATTQQATSTKNTQG